MKLFSTILFAFVFTISLSAQNKKTYTITRTNNAPKIDGILDDEVWKTAQIATDFVQFKPTAGKIMPKNKRTEVKMSYDDSGIYIAAYLYDNPEDMLRQFTQRDDFGQSDFFGAVFNPNNDAQNNTEFFVFSSGTQADATETPSNGEDFGWNAVWESATQTVSDGWIVEMKIPYRTLRFTQQDNPTWGIQFHRHYRNTREQTSWNAIDITSGANIGFFNGELNGLKNLEPPTRLSFYPFASFVTDSFDGETINDFNAGLDIKYGITENFTLDATLIPDFSQVGFDDVQLNLGPFEQQFSEQRQFFTEGTDLFTKGNLFYTRRVGSAPTGYPTLNSNEEIVDGYPQKTNLLNAVKISGRTKNGLGIGFFNAITEKTDIDIIDKTTGQKRTETVEPISNYNILVVDQQFNKNSSVSLINTNVTRNGSNFRDANVTGLLFDLKNKKNTYGAEAQIKMSNLNLQDGTQTGLSSLLAFGKNSGQYRWSAYHEFADKDYDINDMGILFRNNYNNFGAEFNYQIFEPTKNLNNFYIGTWANYNSLFRPGTFTGFNFGGSVSATGKKSLMGYGGNFNVQPGKQYDYFGPRVDGRYFITEDWLNSSVWISSNYNKTFALDANLGYETLFEEGRSYQSVFFGLSPRFKVNEKFIVVYEFDYDQELRERGFIDFIGDDIIYGQRDQITIENGISASYNFNALNSLTLSFRNYWSAVQYENNIFVLGENGRLNRDDNYTKEDIEDPDVNFSTWNLNLTYSWQFAPGSFLTAQYRNRIFNRSNDGAQAFQDTLEDLFNQPSGNTFSLKMVYFIDYNNIKNVFKNKSNTI
ncbi:DUF5916 domain-containing protein [Lacinutrix venerupis]|uniref:Protein with DOMON-like ligand-binding domain protein n=1 Tax=Lacinutrix venerupis TaxID=1486034 RepID=A0AAC9LJT1_9FLAO|nr:DUF5916 domain-containing protein [Lacinutrix venerupis]APY00081.1 protein with DOMON-like ligand-binding domain protein [Lacinutrix venerupis]